MTRTSFVCRRGGHGIYYELGGPEDAPPLVLIRGLSRSSSYWLEFRELLERERRVLVLDNRGVGRSDAPPLPWSTRDMADDVADVLVDSGIRRADVFGISMGGMIAQHLALRHAHRVRRLVLGATSPGGEHAVRPSLGTAATMARAAVAPFREGIRLSAQMALSEAHRASRPETADIWIAIAESEPLSRRGIVGQMLAAAGHDAWFALSRLKAPTLVVTGDADTLIDPRNSRLLVDRLPDATLRMLSGAGHDFPTERPEEAARLVLDFTSRTPEAVSKDRGSSCAD